MKSAEHVCASFVGRIATVTMTFRILRIFRVKLKSMIDTV